MHMKRRWLAAEQWHGADEHELSESAARGEPSQRPPCPAEAAPPAAELPAHAAGFLLEKSHRAQTGYKHVVKIPGGVGKPFQARAGRKSLGYFATAVDAAIAYARHKAARQSQRVTTAGGDELEGSEESADERGEPGQDGASAPKDEQTREEEPQGGGGAPPDACDDGQEEEEVEEEEGHTADDELPDVVESIALVKSRHSQTGYRGVYHVGRVFPTKPFQARHSRRSLGYYATAVEAALAYARHKASYEPAAAKHTAVVVRCGLRGAVADEHAEAGAGGGEGSGAESIDDIGIEESEEPFNTLAASADEQSDECENECENGDEELPGAPKGIVLKKSRHSQSGYVGVTKTANPNKPFQVRVRGKSRGYYTTAVEAAVAYARHKASDELRFLASDERTAGRDADTDVDAGDVQGYGDSDDVEEEEEEEEQAAEKTRAGGADAAAASEAQSDADEDDRRAFSKGLVVGAQVVARDRFGGWCEAKVIRETAEAGPGCSRAVLVHFVGWKSRFDEWIPVPSERFRPSARPSHGRARAPGSSTVAGPSGGRGREQALALLAAAKEHQRRQAQQAEWEQPAPDPAEPISLAVSTAAAARDAALGLRPRQALKCGVRPSRHKQAVLGKRVRILFDEPESEWFAGTIVGFREADQHHRIVYDDVGCDGLERAEHLSRISRRTHQADIWHWHR